MAESETHIGEYARKAKKRKAFVFQHFLEMNPCQLGETCMNKSQTRGDCDTDLTQPRSGPVRTNFYEIVGADGKVYSFKFLSASDAAAWAKMMWPDQEQDEDRTGKGWDVQVAGIRD